MDDHSSSLGPSTSRLGQSTSCLGQSSAKRHLEAPSASSNKRARPSNFIPPSSQSSKPAATPVSCPPISPTTSRPTPSATPAPKTTQAPPVARKRANPFARPPPIPIDMNWVPSKKPDDIFKTFAPRMGMFISGCVYHWMMLGKPYDNFHSLSYDCWELEVGVDSEYRSVYKVIFKPAPRSCCFNCFCPETKDFGHGLRTNCRGANPGWQDWWRAGSYLIFRCRALRELVFGKLVVPVDEFDGDLSRYIKWLFEPATETNKRSNDGRLTNLVMLMYAYIEVSSDGSFEVPEDGFGLGKFFSIAIRIDANYFIR